MKPSYWTPAVYFILFEIFFWNGGKYILKLIQDSLKGCPGYDVNFISFIISLIGILIAVFFFKQFIKHIILLLKGEKDER